MDKDFKTQKGNSMNNISDLIEKIREAHINCADRVQSQELWEDHDTIHLPEDLNPSEKTELIEKMQKILHYYNWADLPTIMQESKTAKFIMIYVDDVSSWWRFEA